jgi:hypothetical protein
MGKPEIKTMNTRRRHIHWTPVMLAAAVKSRRAGRSLESIGLGMGVSRGAVKAALQKAGELAAPLPLNGSAKFRLWRSLELDRLRIMLKDAVPLAKIALALQRSEGACEIKGRERGWAGERRPKRGARAVEEVRARQEVSRSLRAVQGGYLWKKAASEAGEAQDAPQASGGARYMPYLKSLLRWDEKRLADAKAGRGVWAEFEEADRLAEIKKLAEACAVVAAQIRERAQPAK